MQILSEADAPADPAAAVELLRQRLGEAARWCALGFDRDAPAASLRRLTARPLVAGPEMPDAGAEVRGLVDERAAALDSAATGGRPPALGGRLVVFAPLESLADGSSSRESRGYFDEHNTPPQDTWVAAISLDHPLTTPSGLDHVGDQPLILALVPGPVIDTVGYALRANPEECIFWLDQVLPDLAEAVNPPG